MNYQKPTNWERDKLTQIKDLDSWTTTKRPANWAADEWIGKVIPVHEHGFVVLRDFMGNDSEIATAARVSYGKGTKRLSEDRGLNRRLMRDWHTSPFEMCELKFHLKLSIMEMRQIIRQRMASVNEYSGRYSVMDNEFYVPELGYICPQSTTNKQGREDEAISHAVKARHLMLKNIEGAYELYDYLVRPTDQEGPGLGVSREISRSVLPVSVYTQCFWKIDLHNMLHFLRLRLDNHAQRETRNTVSAIAQVVKDCFPLSWEAFEDYRLEALNFSRMELAELAAMLNNQPSPNSLVRNSTEDKEFRAKLSSIGVNQGA
jgi:thymidylate synthase (FAD)